MCVCECVYLQTQPIVTVMGMRRDLRSGLPLHCAR